MHHVGFIEVDRAPITENIIVRRQRIRLTSEWKKKYAKHANKLKAIQTR